MTAAATPSWCEVPVHAESMMEQYSTTNEPVKMTVQFMGRCASTLNWLVHTLPSTHDIVLLVPLMPLYALYYHHHHLFPHLLVLYIIYFVICLLVATERNAVSGDKCTSNLCPISIYCYTVVHHRVEFETAAVRFTSYVDSTCTFFFTFLYNM